MFSIIASVLHFKLYPFKKYLVEICVSLYTTVKSYVFSSGHVWVWELNHKELSTDKLTLLNWEIKLVNLKGHQPKILENIGKTDAEAEAPILWLPDVKSQLTGKDPDAGKDWREKEQGQQIIKIRWLEGITDSVDMNLSKVQSTTNWTKWRTEQPMVSQRVEQYLVTEQQQQRNLSALYMCVSGSHGSHEITWIDAKLGLLKEEFMSGMSYLAILLRSFSKGFSFIDRRI